jgi:hypothetical protein
MLECGYEFPTSWGHYQPHWIDQAKFRLYSTLRCIYIYYFRYDDSLYAKFVRLLRGYLFK